MIKLRDYQNDGIEKIRNELRNGHKRVILCSPTGSGKTVIFSYLAFASSLKQSNVLILTNRVQLLEQSEKALEKVNIISDSITRYKKNVPSDGINIAMVETLKRRLNRGDFLAYFQKIDMIIIDECHIQNFDAIFTFLSDKQVVIGFTATPHRDNKNNQLAKYYTSLVDLIQVSKLIDLGFLSTPKSFGIPIDLNGVSKSKGDYDEAELAKKYHDDEIYKGAVKNWEKYAINKKTIVFSPTIEASKEICNEFAENGYNAKHFDCYMTENDKKDVLEWFFANQDAVLCNVGILTTGFDCPEILCVILYRATTSLPLFLQMVGRGSRITDTKKDFTILDFGNNIHRHGFWEADRNWSLDLEKKKRTKKDVAPVKFCKECEAIVAMNCRVCPECGAILVKEKEKEAVEIMLAELTPNQIMKKANDDNTTVEELEAIRLINNYKVGFVLHRLKTESQFKEYEKLKGYKRGWHKHQFNFYQNDRR